MHLVCLLVHIFYVNNVNDRYGSSGYRYLYMLLSDILADTDIFGSTYRPPIPKPITDTDIGFADTDIFLSVSAIYVGLTLVCTSPAAYT